MTPDQLIQLAREQGDFINNQYGGSFIFNGDDGCTFNIFKFAQLVAEHEREACARVVENIKWSNWFQSDCAAAIRNRTKP